MAQRERRRASGGTSLSLDEGRAAQPSWLPSSRRRQRTGRDQAFVGGVDGEIQVYSLPVSTSNCGIRADFDRSTWFSTRHPTRKAPMLSPQRQ
jgi:hypothetical protein